MAKSSAVRKGVGKSVPKPKPSKKASAPSKKNGTVVKKATAAVFKGKGELDDVSIGAKYVRVAPEVQKALQSKKAVVALESTIITHGMHYPHNRDTAWAVEDIIRKEGAVPATIAIIGGVIRIGLSKDEIDYLAKNGAKNSRKCSRRDLAYVVARKMNGSTTVAGTMYCASLAGIQVFATGGLGGVHRGAEESFDISADLTELAKTPVSVVSAGIKSILDIPKTLEYLETMGVPVTAYGTDWFPDFFTSNSGIKAEFRCDSPAECAGMIHAQRAIGLKTGMIFANPVPKNKEADPVKIKKAIDQALKECEKNKIKGAAITPFMLKRIAEVTKGDSLASNVELIKNNAKLGAKISVELSKLNSAK